MSGEEKIAKIADNESVVVAETGSKSKPSKKKVIGLSLTVLVLLVLGGAAYALASSKSSPKVKVTIDPHKSVSAQVANLSSSETKSLAQSNVNASKDPNAAYAKAVAQNQTGDSKAAVVTFKAVTATGAVNYMVYNDYALAAASTGDLKLAIQNMQKAIDTLNNDKTVSAGLKTSETTRMQNKLDWFKLEAQS